MGMSRVKSLWTDESGFSLPEGIMALTVLAIGIVMTIAPVLSGLDTLAEAKVNQVAANLGQAEIERIRSLDYADVGFPGSSPAGVLAASETVNIQGIDFDITTTVDYVGSVSGLNIVAGGGDGVAGAYDTGIDYKHVTVIVSHPDMQDVRYDTIVAPPNLGAHEGFSNIVVVFSRVEPVGTPTDEITDPYPYSCVRLQDSLTTTYSSSNNDTQTYAGIDPNTVVPTDPDYYYDVRLGSGCDEQDSFTGWRIHPNSMSSAEVHVGPTATATAALELYYPATLEVIAEDEFGADLSVAELTVTQGAVSETYDETSPEFDAGTATFTLTEFDGNPIVPGFFDVTLDSTGYIQETKAGVAVPSGYPTVMTETVTFNLIGGGSYVPGTLEVVALDEFSAPLTGENPVLTVTQGAVIEVFTDSSSEWDSGTSTFTITTFDGAPLTAAPYDLNLDADDHQAADINGVTIPSGATQTETFYLQEDSSPTTTSTTTTTIATTTTTGPTITVNWDFYVEDWENWAIHGAKIEFTGGSTGTITAYTDEYGTASVDLVLGDTMTLTVDSGYGHEVYTAVVTPTADDSLSLQLDMPATHGGIKYRNGILVPIDHMGYGLKNTDILDLVPVLLNWEGQATVAVIADGSRWDNSGFCDDDSINFNKRRRIDFPGQVKSVNIWTAWNWSGC